MELRIEIVGEIVERQELLNGTMTIALEGADASGDWTLAGVLSWNRGLVESAGEGDLTLVRRDGAEIFSTLTGATVTDARDDGDADHQFRAAYEVDGGSGAFEGASGDAEGAGWMTGDAFRGAWTLRLHIP
jgi:hypothetical protein